MIISDKHRFVFIHIPKCAGTSVRRSLAPFDDAGGVFSERVAEHPALGLLDYTHIPLVVLRDHFPDEFRKVADYETFAVLRDPYARFASAFSQRMKMHQGEKLGLLSTEDIEREAGVIISHLEKNNIVAPQFIHFAPQSLYIDLDGVRLVKNVYPLEDVAALEARLANLIGAPLASFGHANKSLDYRWRGVAPLMHGASRVLRAVLPQRTVAKLRARVAPYAKRPRDSAEAEILDLPGVRAFIASHYKQDFQAYDASRRRPATDLAS